MTDRHRLDEAFAWARKAADVNPEGKEAALLAECERLRAENDRLVQECRDRAAATRSALAAYRSALRSGERETDQLRAVGDAALGEADDD